MPRGNWKTARNAAIAAAAIQAVLITPLVGADPAQAVVVTDPATGTPHWIVVTGAPDLGSGGSGKLFPVPGEHTCDALLDLCSFAGTSSQRTNAWGYYCNGGGEYYLICPNNYRFAGMGHSIVLPQLQAQGHSDWSWAPAAGGRPWAYDDTCRFWIDSTYGNGPYPSFCWTVQPTDSDGYFFGHMCYVGYQWPTLIATISYHGSDVVNPWAQPGPRASFRAPCV